MGHRYRSHCRPGTGAGSQSGTQVPEPMWDRGTELSQIDLTPSCGLFADFCLGRILRIFTKQPLTRVVSRGPEGSRTPDLTRARGALYQLSYWP
jgi:hypothetical protein